LDLAQAFGVMMRSGAILESCPCVRNIKTALSNRLATRLKVMLILRWNERQEERHAG
jgi:hypothetical protein